MQDARKDAHCNSDDQTLYKVVQLILPRGLVADIPQRFSYPYSRPKCKLRKKRYQKGGSRGHFPIVYRVNLEFKNSIIMHTLRDS